MTLTFTIYITDEGIRATREVQQNPGWYIIPYQFRVSDTNRGINAQRTYSSIDSNPWYSGLFSALTASGTENKIIHNVVIPPIISGVTTDKNYGEIYFIYKDHNGNELLYAIGAPSETVTYIPGVAQKFYFSFTLNNVQVADVINITDTSAQDIEDHNIDTNAHTYLLKRDGTRTATGILQYSQNLTFSTNNDIVNKKYVDDADNVIKTNLTSKGSPTIPIYFDPNGNATNCTMTNVHVIVSSTSSSGRWVRIYDDNWCEQGGYASGASTVTLSQAYSDAAYTVCTGAGSVSSKSTTSFYISSAGDWIAAGYKA